MADPVLALAVLQVVTPVAVAAMPAIWKQIEKVLRWLITRNARHSSRQDTNLACINTILDTLDRFPDLSWTSENHSQALLNQLKIKTESLRKMIENENAFMRFIQKGKFAKHIQSIAVMMQLLETNVRTRQASTFFQCNTNHDVNKNKLDLNFYTESRENLIKDLDAKLREDNLKPVVIESREDYEASIEKSGTYPRIRYEFQPVGASSYPRTLTISRGVRECIELLLKKLRDLQLMEKTQNTGGSVLVGVALYDYFTEILPKVLMDYLVARRSTLRSRPHAAQQFFKNLSFFRSFSVSSTFQAIQGSNGLRLEEEDKVLNIDLQQPEWVTWEDVQRMSLEVGTSSGRATRTASGHIESRECVLCGLHISGALLDTELERHWEACFRREKRLNSFKHTCCPVCHEDMDHMSEEERGLHANACLDRGQSGPSNNMWSGRGRPI